MVYILDEIVENKGKEVSNDKKEESLDELKKKIRVQRKVVSFKSALSKEGIHIIAEIKRRSPSEKKITSYPPLKIAKVYQDNKAAAISILTDRKYFGGSKEIMGKISKIVSKPILRKDFIIDEYQICQSRAYGADAILLISSILTDDELERFIKISHSLGMDCLVETHTVEEVEKLNNLSVPVDIYGINNRNLKDDKFRTDLKTTERLIQRIPEGRIVVSESGIKTPEDILYLSRLGVNAVLTGTCLLKSNGSELRIINKINSLLSLVNKPGGQKPKSL